MPAVMTGFTKICQEICQCHIFVQISALLTEHKLVRKRNVQEMKMRRQFLHLVRDTDGYQKHQS